MSLPSVLSYLDFRAFLTDWFNARKRADPKYSYARFAQDGGCSKAALANVIGGARLPRPATVDAFATAMSLNPTEKTYLGHLVDLAGAPTQAGRHAVMERILASEQFGQVRRLENESDEAMDKYFGAWWIPAIRELAVLPGFREDPVWLAATMNPPITPEQAKSALETLFELGFLVRTDNGIETREIQFRTEPEAAQKAVLTYYRDVLPQLLITIQRNPEDEQHLLAATLLLDQSVIPEFKAKLNAMVNQLGAIAETVPRVEGARVYQLVFQLLPVSAKSLTVSDESSS